MTTGRRARITNTPQHAQRWSPSWSLHRYCRLVVGLVLDAPTPAVLLSLFLTISYAFSLSLSFVSQLPSPPSLSPARPHARPPPPTPSPPTIRRRCPRNPCLRNKRSWQAHSTQRPSLSGSRLLPRRPRSLLLRRPSPLRVGGRLSAPRSVLSLRSDRSFAAHARTHAHTHAHTQILSRATLYPFHHLLHHKPRLHSPPPLCAARDSSPALLSALHPRALLR